MPDQSDAGSAGIFCIEGLHRRTVSRIPGPSRAALLEGPLSDRRHRSAFQFAFGTLVLFFSVSFLVLPDARPDPPPSCTDLDLDLDARRIGGRV
eukprot:1175819-Prorocentrum_minimum.AAC.1